MLLRFSAIVVAASVTMLVAGCGGSGSDPTDVPGQLAGLTAEQRKQAATTASSAAGMEPRQSPNSDGSFSSMTQSSGSDDVVVTVKFDNEIEYEVVNGATWSVSSTGDTGVTSRDTPTYRGIFSGKELTKKVTGGTVFVDVYSDHKGTPTTKEDADYLAGGVWLYVPDGSGTGYSYGAFVSGNSPTDTNTVSEVTGKASYTGDATGAYLNDMGKIGYLDGDVSLTANFNSDSIEGKISRIRTDGKLLSGELVLENSLDLGTIFKGIVSGTVDKNEYEGQWGGQFFGTRDVTKTNNNVKTTMTYPGSVGGTFGATTDSGPTFVGIFGANFGGEIPE